MDHIHSSPTQALKTTSQKRSNKFNFTHFHYKHCTQTFSVLIKKQLVSKYFFMLKNFIKNILLPPSAIFSGVK